MNLSMSANGAIHVQTWVDDWLGGHTIVNYPENILEILKSHGIMGIPMNQSCLGEVFNSFVSTLFQQNWIG